MSRKTYIAEGVATFCLVLVSAGAVVVDAGYGGDLGHLGKCIAAGLVVTTMVYCVGDFSGAHLNPAVTIGFWAARRFPARHVPGYIGAQLLGSLAAAGLIRVSLGVHGHLGATVTTVEPHTAFIVEIVATFLLMYVILCVATGSKEKGTHAAIAIGGAVLMNCIWAGPLTGAAMNPARTFGPSLLGDAAPGLWLYCTAPVIGAAIAVIAHRLTHPPDNPLKQVPDFTPPQNPI